VALFDFFKRKPQPAPAPKPVPAPAPVHAPQPVAEVAPEPVADAGPDLATDHDGPERRGRVRRNARSGTRVLVIDDSPTIVALLKRMLQQNQFEVLEAFDAESGIEIARREVPGLIFLDIVLPGMDGFNALRTLRRDPATKHVPIIMISGNAQATEQFYVQRIGADDFMKKPFSRAEVFNRIEALLDEDDIPRHGSKPGTRAEAAAAAGDA
jgi:twitching motility two-component system response regulator PilH